MQRAFSYTAKVKKKRLCLCTRVDLRPYTLNLYRLFMMYTNDAPQSCGLVPDFILPLSNHVLVVEQLQPSVSGALQLSAVVLKVLMKPTS